MNERRVMSEAKTRCYCCGQYFYKSETPHVEIHKGKFAHSVCSEIHIKMKSILKQGYNEAKINKQIKDNLVKDITPDKVLKTLEYWYDIEQNDASLAAGGIGIVPFIYQEAEQYFERKNRINQTPKKNINDYLTDDIIVTKIKPKPIKKPTGVRLFHLE